ncbi:MAG: radical SAM protein [Elusimicrobia bacterium]|nr:radical SAM protein [Elusimicrobiota bacterium]
MTSYYRNKITKVLKGKTYIRAAKTLEFRSPYKEIWLRDSIELPNNNGFLLELKRLGLVKSTPPNASITFRDDIRSIHVQLNNFCTNKCRHCYAGEQTPHRLTADDMRHIIDDAVKIGAWQMDYSGGEPTLNPDFEEIISYGRSLGLHQMLFSNGFMVVEKFRAIKASIHLAQISIDGDAEFHDYFRKRKGSYATAIEAIRTLVGANVPTIIAMSVVEENLHLIDKVKRLMEQIIGHASTTAEFHYPELLPAQPKCEALSENLYIDAKGDVYPCPLLCRKDISLGNYWDKGGWDEVLGAPEFARALNLKRTKWIAPKQKCIFWCPAYFCGENRDEYPYGDVNHP